jgi:hypothetical protein
MAGAHAAFCEQRGDLLAVGHGVMAAHSGQYARATSSPARVHAPTVTSRLAWSTPSGREGDSSRPRRPDEGAARCSSAR